MKRSHADLVSLSSRTLVEVVPAINRALRLLTGRLLQDVITVPQYRVLVLLKEHPQSSLKDLAEREGVEPPTVSRTVDSLVDKGLIDRRIDPDDRRKVRITLLPVGTALVERVRRDVANSLESALAGWDGAHLEHLLEALSRLQESPLLTLSPEALHG